MPKSNKRADGRLVKTMTDPRTKKRVYFYGKTEREINRKIMEYSRRIDSGRTFLEVSEEWWEEASPSLAYQSQKAYKPAKKRAEIHFGDIPIKDIKPRDITAFLRILANQDYAQKTIANQRLVINLICEHAIREGDIEMNPCASAKAPKDTKKTSRTAASATDEEIIKKSSDVWLFPFIAIMTGMRKGEILALQWKDIDFENNIIMVTKSVYHEGDRPLIKSPKTEAGNRIVPLLQPLKEKLQAIKNKSPDHFIISDTGERPLSNRRYTTEYTRFKDETGIGCTAHQLRHSFATIAFECGVPVKSVQEILGHKQLSTTMDLYTDFRKKSFDDAASSLNAFLSNDAKS